MNKVLILLLLSIGYIFFIVTTYDKLPPIYPLWVIGLGLYLIGVYGLFNLKEK